jgi:hypothetical protein
MGDWEGDGASVPRFNLYPCNSRVWTVPGSQWCVGQFAIADLTAISADAMIKILPDASMDSAWSTIPTAVRNRVKTDMEGAGFTWAVQNTWTVREVLNYAAGQIQPGVNVEAGDVRDIEA